MKRKFILMVVALVLVSVAGASPSYVNYQGRLTDENGDPFPAGSYKMAFSIWDQATEGIKKWGPFSFDGGTGNGQCQQILYYTIGILPAENPTGNNSEAQGT